MDWHDLETLRQSIDLLERKIDFLFKHCDVVFEEGDRPRYLVDAEELLRGGRDHEAMKIISEQDAIGLIEARDVVDRMKATLGLIAAAPDAPARELLPVARVAVVDVDHGDVDHGDVDHAIEAWKASAEQWKDAIEGWTATDPSETVVYEPDDDLDDCVTPEHRPQKPAAWRPNVNNGLGKYFRKQRFEE